MGWNSAGNAKATITHHNCGQDQSTDGPVSQVRVASRMFFAFAKKRCTFSALSGCPELIGNLVVRLRLSEVEYWDVTFPDTRTAQHFLSSCQKQFKSRKPESGKAIAALSQAASLKAAATLPESDPMLSSPGKAGVPLCDIGSGSELIVQNDIGSGSELIVQKDRSGLSQPVLPLREEALEVQVGKPLGNMPLIAQPRLELGATDTGAKVEKQLPQEPRTPPRPSSSANSAIKRIAYGTSEPDEQRRRSESEAKKRKIDEKAGTLASTSSQKRLDYHAYHATALPQRAAPRRESVLRAPTLPSRTATPQSSSSYRSFRSSVTFGLKNLGNTCYLNAVLQAFCALRELTADLQAMRDSLPLCQDGPIFQSTLEIVQQIGKTATPRYGALSPAKLREQIARSCPVFGTAGQQDAHEFLLEYVNQLHDEMLGAQKRWVASMGQNAAPADVSESGVMAASPRNVAELATQRHLDAEVRKTLTCAQCQRPHDKYERFRDFSLDFPNREASTDLENSTSREVMSIRSMILEYFSSEFLDVKCEHCPATAAHVDKELSAPPRVLILHLKRYVPNIQLQRYDKQHQRVDIPLELILCARSKAVAPAQMSQPGESCSTRSAEEADAALGAGARMPARPLAGTPPETCTCEILGPPSKAEPQADTAVDAPEPQKYKLRAVIAHSGVSPHSGHYVCYAQNAAGDWWQFDDSSVWQCNMDQEMRHIGSNAYILFYVACGEDSQPQEHVGVAGADAGEEGAPKNAC